MMLTLKNIFLTSAILCFLVIGNLLMQPSSLNPGLSSKQKHIVKEELGNQSIESFALTRDLTKTMNNQRLDILETQYTQTDQRLQKVIAKQAELHKRQNQLWEIMDQLGGMRDETASSFDQDDIDISTASLSDETMEEQIVSYFDQQLAEESLDPQWSKVATEEFENIILTEDLTDTALLESECKSTFCRTEFVHQNEMALENFNNRFSDAIIGNTSIYYEVFKNPDGSITTRAYVSRDGYDLPFDPES